MIDDKTDKLANILTDEEQSGAFKIAVSLEAKRLTQEYENQISKLENKIYELSEDKEELKRVVKNLQEALEESNNRYKPQRAYTIEELSELKEILFPTAIVRDKLNRRIEE